MELIAEAGVDLSDVRVVEEEVALDSSAELVEVFDF